MTVKIRIDPVLRQFTQDQKVIDVDGSTIGACLRQLVARFPEMNKVIFRQDGTFLHYVVICVNGETVDSAPLARPVNDGDEVQLIPIITGGL